MGLWTFLRAKSRSRKEGNMSTIITFILGVYTGLFFAALLTAAEMEEE